MSTFNKFQHFVADLANKVHNLSSDQLTLALTNVTPVANNAILTDITQISYTNLSSRNVATTSSSQSGGLYKLILTNLVLTASGPVGPFQYVVLYNSTAVSNNLIGWYDIGSAITMQATDTFSVTWDGANGVLSLQ